MALARRLSDIDTDMSAERLQCVVEGDAAAFTELVRTYQRPVYNLVYSIVRNADDAQDIVQDVWVKVARCLPQLREPARFTSWLFRIARNCSNDYYSAKKSRPQSALTARDEDDEQPFDVEDAHAEIPEDHVVAQDERRKVWETLGGLSEADRTILFLRESRELPYAEIAQTLGITCNAAEVRVFRARERFRKEFMHVEDAPSDCNVSPLQLSAFVDGELGQATRTMLERHSATCHGCTQRLRAISVGRRLYAGDEARDRAADASASQAQRVRYSGR